MNNAEKKSNEPLPEPYDAMYVPSSPKGFFTLHVHPHIPSRHPGLQPRVKGVLGGSPYLKN